jgi:hypothetical protein
MALQGDLSTMPVRQLLTWLADGRATGQLSLSHAMVVRRFHLRGGRVMLASSSEEPNLLGRLLVERGLVKEAELERVLDQRGGTRPRLGKALAEAGLVSPAALSQVLAEKVQRLLTGALTWTEGTFYFDDEAPARRQAAVSTSVDLAAVLELARGAGRRSGEETMAVTDADVIEMHSIAGERRPGQTGRRTPREGQTREGHGRVDGAALPRKKTPPAAA